MIFQQEACRFNQSQKYTVIRVVFIWAPYWDYSGF